MLGQINTGYHPRDQNQIVMMSFVIYGWKSFGLKIIQIDTLFYEI